MLSYADLIQLGGYAAVEYCGGPTMLFKMGRLDAEEVSQSDKLVDASEPKMTQYQKFNK
jgi:catalase (peroxidase I)